MRKRNPYTNPTEEYITDITIPLWKKILFALTDLGSPMTSFYVTSFLIVFFTDIALLPMASISLLLLVGRIFDAINNPIIGTMLDKRDSKNRYRPFAVFGPIGTAIVVLGMFSVNPAWNTNIKIAWLWGFYFLYTIVSTFRIMAYKALCGVVTSNGMERTKLGSIRGLMTSIGSNIPGIIAIPLITYFSGENAVLTRRGYLITLAILLAIGLPLAVFCPLTLPERIRKPRNQSKTIAMKELFKCTFQNPPMIFCILGCFMFGLLTYGRSSFLLYFAKYNLGNAELYSMLMTTQLLFSVISCVVMPYLFRVMKNKGHVCAGGLLLSAAGSFCMYFYDGNSIVCIVICMAMVALGGNTFSAMNMALVGDAADNAELKFGLRVDGFMNATASMAQEFGSAITPAVGTAVIGAIGFVSGAQTQSAAVMQAISLHTWLLPGILSLLAGIMFLFYKLSDERHREIVVQLENRRRLEMAQK